MAARKVLTIRGVMDATGWSRSTIYSKIAEGRFPPSFKWEQKMQKCVWFEDEVEAWQKGHWKLPDSDAGQQNGKDERQNQNNYRHLRNARPDQ